jgi:hypothetical protein
MAVAKHVRFDDDSLTDDAFDRESSRVDLRLNAFDYQAAPSGRIRFHILAQIYLLSKFARRCGAVLVRPLRGRDPHRATDATSPIRANASEDLLTSKQLLGLIQRYLLPAC